MTDIWKRLRGGSDPKEPLTALMHQAAAEGERLRELEAQVSAALADQAAEMQKMRVPICIGRSIIGILAQEGTWRSKDGQGLIAADELFNADPYAEVERLRSLVTTPAVVTELRMENARLQDTLGKWMQIADRYDAENVRLKAALREMADCGEHPCAFCFEMAQVARAALEGKP